MSFFFYFRWWIEKKGVHLQTEIRKKTMDSHQYRVDLPESSDMASEPVGFYNDAAYKIRHSAIVSEISRLGKNETIWLIRTMQQHLEDLSQKNGSRASFCEPDALEALDELSLLVTESGKTAKELVDEYLREKYMV